MAVRVLLVTGEYPPDEGGVADYSRCLAQALADQGLGVEVLTSRRPAAGGAGDREGDPAVPPGGLAGGVREAAAPSAGEQGRAAMVRGPRVGVHRVVRGWGWGSLGGLRRVLTVLRPDVVHVQYQAAAFDLHPSINVLPWWLRRTTNVFTVVTYHDLRVPYLFPKAGRLRGLVSRWPARWSHLTLATNVADWSELRASGRPWRLALVPIGSNLPDAPPPGYEREAWRAGQGLGPDTRLLAYFGFLNASKGGRVLVNTLARLRTSGQDVRLLMLGGRVGASDASNAAYLAAFESDLAAADLAGQVIWTDHVPPASVSAWLHAADLAVLPYADGASYRRGSLLACLAHGLPVVTTEPESLPETALAGLAAADRPPHLVDGQAARLVPVGDAEAFAAAVAELLAAPDLAGRLGLAGRALAGWFAWERIAARHLALYQSGLAARATSVVGDPGDGEV